LIYGQAVRLLIVISAGVKKGFWVARGLTEQSSDKVKVCVSLMLLSIIMKINWLTRVLSVALFISLLVGAAAGVALTGGANGLYGFSYTRIETRYVSTSTPLGTQLVYEVTEASYSGSSPNFTTKLNTTSYTSASIGNEVSGTIRLSSDYNAAAQSVSINVSGDVGTLLSVSVQQETSSQFIWAGVRSLNGTLTFAAPAFINESQPALIKLGFASDAGIYFVAEDLGVVTKVSASLPKVSFTVSSTSSTDAAVSTAVPQPYAQFSLAASWQNTSATVDMPVTGVSVSAYLGAEYPVVTWSGGATAYIAVGSSGMFPANASSWAAEFFGVNGTPVGYVTVSDLAFQHSAGAGNVSFNIQIFSSATTISTFSQPFSLTLAGPTKTYNVSVSGEPVVVQLGSKLSAGVESTARVELSHTVDANGSLLLLLLNTSKSHAYIVVNPSVNSVSIVRESSVDSVSFTQLTVGNISYNATQVGVNVSGYTVFNLSVDYPSVLVFKSTSSGVFELNYSNYWVSNGRVYVFDDPADTYYVANAASATTITSQSPTSSPQSSSTVTSSAKQTGPSSAQAAGAAVVILLVLVVVFLILKRRRYG
jgi:hypothetical protein